jgi:hypothetical protein
MKLKGNNSSSQAFLLLVAVCLGAALGFQQQSTLPLRPPSAASPQHSVRSRRQQPVVLFLNTPPQFPQYDDDEFDVTPFETASSNSNEPQPIEPQGIPKLKLPTPNLQLPELDFKEVLKRFAALAVTVIAFLAIQKLGLLASEIFTPELTAEQVRNYQY